MNDIGNYGYCKPAWSSRLMFMYQKYPFLSRFHNEWEPVHRNRISNTVITVDENMPGPFQ